MSVRPDFVMLGVREPDGSASIYASTELRHADLIAHREAPLAVMLAGDPRKIPPTRFELEAVLGSYAEGHGGSYAEALLDLMRTWQPPDGRRSLIEEIAAVGTGSYADAKAAGLAEPIVLQRGGSHLGLVINGDVVDAPDALRDEESWVTVHDWTGRLVYDGRGPVPPELVTLDAADVAEGRIFTFDVRPLTVADRIDKLSDTLTRPRRHDQCDTEHAPGQCLVHDKRAKNCRYDDVPAELRLVIEGRWCEPCLRETVEEANPRTDTPVEIAAESQRRFLEDPEFHARAVEVDRIVVESVQRIFGRTLSDGEHDTAKFAAAVALVVAERSHAK